VDVDVVAHDRTVSPPILYLVECKHWSKAVPRTVVHAFRTVVQDSGAHVGLIVSRSGFQSGAGSAAESANISLVTWNEFQLLFVERWKAGRYAQLQPLLEKVFEFYDYFSAPIGNAIAGSRVRLDEWNALLKKHSCLADANPWGQMLGPRTWPPALPGTLEMTDADGAPFKQTFHDYASLFAFVERRAHEALGDFNAFVTRYRTGPVGTS
jgi:hypothetical protein